MYQPATNGNLLVTPRGYSTSENNVNVFDKAFNNVVDMEEWADWVKWEGNNEMIFPNLDRRESTTSTISSPEAWSLGVESAGTEFVSTSYTTDNTFPNDDAPFEFEESQGDLVFERTTTTAGRPQQDARRSIRGFSSLTEAEERQLQAIAMPYQALSKIKISPSSRATSISSPSPSPSAEPEQEIQARKTRKRKSVNDEEIPSALCLSRKRGHNAIEVCAITLTSKPKTDTDNSAQKRYRTNLNDKINLLREALPVLQRTASMDSKMCDDDEDSENEKAKTNHPKCGKAATLTRALEYIKHLEIATQRLGEEANVLQTRIGAFEKLAMSGSVLKSSSVLGLAAPQRKESATLETIQAGMFISCAGS